MSKEKVKQNEKAEELLSTEKARENPQENKYQNRNKQFTNKEFKTLVIKMLTELGKTADPNTEQF